jgi:hypothetical protein
MKKQNLGVPEAFNVQQVVFLGPEHALQPPESRKQGFGRGFGVAPGAGVGQQQLQHLVVRQRTGLREQSLFQAASMAVIVRIFAHRTPKSTPERKLLSFLFNIGRKNVRQAISGDKKYKFP